MPAGVPIWLRHDASLAHDIPGHPERPARLRGLEAVAAAEEWFGWDVVASPPATREQIERVHPAAYVDAIESLCASGGGAIDLDTACVPDTWPAALHGAGGAVALVDALMTGAAPSGFSAHRPPGHHAEPDRAMGFCFLSNAAIAAEHALLAHGARRVLVLDWDVHHGNGTEAAFLARDEVLFVSLHQWPLYPGTGAAADVGTGAGAGYTVNVPLPSGSGDAAFVSLVEHLVVPLARVAEPGLVLVSAGFDAHVEDPLASCRVTEAGFAGMTASLRRVCAELGVPLGLILEGGYSVEALASSVRSLAPVLGAAQVPAPPRVERHPLAVEAVRRTALHWPALTSA